MHKRGDSFHLALDESGGQISIWLLASRSPSDCELTSCYRKRAFVANPGKWSAVLLDFLRGVFYRAPLILCERKNLILQPTQ
jgi:hypothetical protein